MTKTVTIDTRAEGLVGHGGPINEIVVREPTLAEYVEHGEPVIYNRMPDGSFFAAENTVAIAAYIKACLVSPTDSLLIEKASLRTGRQLRGAILGFFREETLEGAAS